MEALRSEFAGPPIDGGGRLTPTSANPRTRRPPSNPSEDGIRHQPCLTHMILMNSPSARFAEGRALGEVLLGFDAAQERGRDNADNFRLEQRLRFHRFFAAHWVSEIDVCLTDKLLASAEHSKLRFEPRSSAKNVIACFALRSILTF
jgi:hypothetical protein